MSWLIGYIWSNLAKTDLQKVYERTALLYKLIRKNNRTWNVGYRSKVRRIIFCSTKQQPPKLVSTLLNKLYTFTLKRGLEWVTSLSITSITFSVFCYCHCPPVAKLRQLSTPLVQHQSRIQIHRKKQRSPQYPFLSKTNDFRISWAFSFSNGTKIT